MVETNFKHTDLGLIPHDWEVKSIKETAPLQRGFDLPKKEQKDGIYPVVYSNGICSYHDKYMVNGPGVVTGRSGTIGNIHYVESNYWPHNTSLWVTTFNGNFPKFVYYLFCTFDWKQFAAGSGVPSLNRNSVHEKRLAFPPTIAEQERIAGALSSIDTLIGALNEQIEKKRHIKQGTMQQLLTGKKRFAGFTGAWKEVRLGDNCAITTGHKDVNIAVPNGQYNFYTCSRDVYKANTYSFDTEAILIAGNGDVGNLHYHKGKFEVYQRTYVLYDFKADVQYILHNLAWNLITHLKQGVVGSTIPYIVIGQLLDYPLVLPPTIAEQSAIAAVLSGMDTEIAALEQKRDKYIAIKSGMMQDLLTGKIRLV